MGELREVHRRTEKKDEDKEQVTDEGWSRSRKRYEFVVREGNFRIWAPAGKEVLTDEVQGQTRQLNVSQKLMPLELKYLRIWGGRYKDSPKGSASGWVMRKTGKEGGDTGHH